ncbi:uncharacterized protein Meltrin [Bemisia tabaci]
MAKFSSVFVFFSCLISFCADNCVASKLGGYPSSSPHFSRGYYIKPRVLHAREKRHIHTSKVHQDRNEHINDISVEYHFGDRNHILDLQLNKELIPENYFERHQRNGSIVVTRPGPGEVELCHYHGVVRDVPESWVALSTCDGLRGVIFDGKNMLFVEKDKNTTSLSDKHIVFAHSDLISNHTCGYADNPYSHIIQANKLNNKIRSKRDTGRSIRGPYNIDSNSRFIELVLVVDNKEYITLDKSIAKTNQHCKDIANIINSLFMPLNIFVALTGVVIWTENDEITLSTKGDTTLQNFLIYRREHLTKEHPNDNAQLLTKIQFEGGVVGKALKGPICTYEFSGGVNMDHSNVVGLVANTVAHEMGHNLGMEHDTDDCECPSDRCIMSPSSSSMTPTDWSSCSKDYLAVAFGHGMDYCLRNKPEKLFDGAVCGNGFVEPGEECDCGLKERCDNPCCDYATCKLHSNATCATGLCCNLKTCQVHSAGKMCRESNHECDLPEFCDGQSEYCPDNVFKMNGLNCDRGEAYCFDGTCRTRSDQCRSLWGPSGNQSDPKCFDMNMRGTKHGNCGYNLQNKTFVACSQENIECGMLHCQHLNERLEFGMESVAILSHSYFNNEGIIIPCRSAIVDLGLTEVDPGLAPNGAKCGSGKTEKMCVHQRCVPVADVLAATPDICREGCNGQGVCNNKGHCHCNDGFAPPFCDYPGLGGSVDSGPASDPNAWHALRTFIYFVFFLLLPLASVVMLFMYYVRNRQCWAKKPHIVSSANSVEKKPRLSPDRSRANHEPNFGQSLLNQNNLQSASNNPIVASLQNNLIGHLKGFKITPLQVKKCESSVTLVPTRPAPQPYKTSISGVSSEVVNSYKPPTNPIRAAPKVPMPITSVPLKSEPPALPPANATQNEAKPLISSPVLDSTTACNVKELVSASPTRPAPSLPPANLSGEDFNRSKSQNSTLTRIASFISRSQKPDVPAKPKLDRDTLRSIKISDPIPQTNIELPMKSLTIVADKPNIHRAHSFRQNTDAKKRPQIQSFGSMRVPNNRRPQSIPACTRPTSPPPRPPPPIQGVPGYQEPSKPQNTYDDCLNLMNSEVASVSNPADNIYAVIEESPTDRRERKEIILPTKKNFSGDGSTESSATESMGLLDEIVSEMEARNTESIYSTGTWKKYRDVDSISSVTNFSSVSNDVDQLYANIPPKSEEIYSNLPKSSNSSTTSSGYLSPITAKNKFGLKRPPDDEAKQIKMPTITAPSYKPLSQLHRDNALSAALGADFSAVHNSTKFPVDASKNSSKATPSVTLTLKEAGAKPVLPSNFTVVNSLSKINSNSSHPLSDKPAQRAKLKLERNSSDSSGSYAKPDLVSSCDIQSTDKPPDVLNSKPASGLATKKIVGKQPLPAPKPTNLPPRKNIVSNSFKNSKNLGKKPTDSKVNSRVDSVSHVASLQKKFESNVP